MHKKVKFSNVNLLFEELEPRLLLSADGLAVITETNVATAQELVLGDNETNTLFVQNHTEQSSFVVQAKQHSSELVIIDSRVPNFQQLHNDIIRAQQQGRDINVVILDVHRDGIEQISEALSKYNKLDAVHIVSHGKDAQLQLGATQLNKQTLQQRSDEINKWQQVFSDGGDLLLYGCNLAENQQGKQFVDELAQLTGADIAASDDTTGHQLLGGDWDFEYNVGDIETQVVFSDNMQQQWQGTLPTATNLNAAEFYTEDTALDLTDIVVSGSSDVTVTLTLSDVAAGSLNTDTSGSVTSTFVGSLWTASGAEVDVNILLAGLSLTPSLNYNSDFTIATSVDDGVAPALNGTKNFTGTAVNDAPVIDLDADDSSGSTGVDFQTTFIEQSSAVNITDGDVSLIDVDSANLTSIIVTLTNGQPSGNESLAADTSGTGLTAVWDGINDILTISGSATVADYLSVLATVIYDNTTTNPSANDRIIEFVANDGTDTSVIATTTVSVVQIKKPPVANDDAFTVDEGSTNILDLAVNDTDANGDLDPSSITIVSGPTNGTITAINADGTVEYVHDGSETLSDSFTYTIKDLVTAVSNTATVTLTINLINDAPTATNLSAPETYTEDITLNLTDIVVSDVDSANVIVTLTLSDVGAGSLSTGTSNAVTSTFVDGVWTASGAIADVNTLLAGVTFTPTLNYNSNFSIATSVDDGIASAITGTKVINGTNVDDPAVIGGVISYIGNKGDAVGGTMTATDVDDLTDGTYFTVTGAAAFGTASIDAATGAWTFVPTDPNWFGSDSFTVTVTDDLGGTTTQVVNITLTNVNDPAIIGGVDTGNVTEDVDPDLDTLLETNGALTITDVDPGEVSFNAGVYGGIYGVITLNATGDWDYAANNGQAAIQNLAAGATIIDTITVSSVDGTTHDINITITGTNDVPVAGNDIVNVNEGASVIIDVAATDSDIDSALDLNSIVITGAPVNGSYTVNGDGTVTYNHDGSETLSDSFTYTISDISGAISNTATVNITVTPVNDLPVAQDDNPAILDQGSTAIFDLAANDSDSDNALDLNSIVITGAPANGSLIVNGDGTVSYTHDGSQTSTDSFSYTISDISGAISNVATVNITVNLAPTTTGIGNVTVAEDSTATNINLNAAFDDADNLDSELSYAITGNTSIGLFNSTAINAATGELVLDYAADMSGFSQISIRATDPLGAFVDTLFSVTVTPVNDAPVLLANTDLAVAGTNNTVISNTNLNVDDIDNTNAEILYTVTTLPTNGELLINGVVAILNSNFTEDDLINNRLSYQSGGSAISDQFAFTVSDGAGGTIAANTFNIAVLIVPPEAEVITIVDPEPLPEPVVTVEPVDTEITLQAEVPTETVSEREDWYVGSNNTAPQQAGLTLDPVPQTAPDPVVPEDFNTFDESIQINEVAENDLSTARTVADLQVKSIKVLMSAIDQMNQQIDENLTEDIVELEFRAAAVSSSGVALTAGVVAWVLRGGALMTSLITTIPVWKAYDPLPILAYRDHEDEEKNIAEDKIPTSLEEVRKIKAMKEKMKKHNQVDDLFSGPGDVE